MRIDRLYFPWRPLQILKLKACYIPTKKLETDGQAIKILSGFTEEKIKALATPPIPDDGIEETSDFYEQLIEKEELISKYQRNRQKKAEAKGSRNLKRTKQIPSGILDEVINFFITYDGMKNDFMSDEERDSLKTFIDTTKKNLYHRIKGYKGLNSQVTTLIRLLNEKPSL